MYQSGVKANGVDARRCLPARMARGASDLASMVIYSQRASARLPEIGDNRDEDKRPCALASRGLLRACPVFHHQIPASSIKPPTAGGH